MAISHALPSTRRPWSELFFHQSSYSLPNSIGEFSSRIRWNLNHFRVNYAEIVMSALIVRQFWVHPFTIIECLIVLMVQFFMYWRSKHQMVVLNRSIDDRLVILAVIIFMAVTLALTMTWLSVLVSSIIGVGMVIVHAGLRKSEDLFLDEEEAVEVGLVSVVGNNNEPSPATYIRT